jgi:hypothetical protein
MEHRQPEAQPAQAIEREPRLAPTFAGIIAVQIVVIAALYWAGRYFGSIS